MPSSPSIVGVLECLNSRRDTFGNCYYAFTYTDTQTGKTVKGTVSGGESNVRGLMFVLNGGNWEPRNVRFTVTELPIRAFNRLVKLWPYAGCTPDDLATFVRRSLTE